ncbi:MAG: permease, partial [Planctomycetaceae bacterium]|nr:permease [Planctomycetaceae bacterium]
LLMAFIFRKEEQEKIAVQAALPETTSKRSLWQNILFFAALFGILVFLNCGCSEKCTSVWTMIYNLLAVLCGTALGVMLVLWFGLKWWKVIAAAVPVAALACLFPCDALIPFVAAILGLSLITGTDKGECGDWFAASWSFAKQMLPLLLFGILIAGLLLGGPGEEGLIPSEWVAWAVGGNSLRAHFIASFAGSFMYLVTLTEVPFVQALVGAGMGNGPALAFLLAGPSISLPSMLIINSVLGPKKTAVFVGLIIVSSMACGMTFGYFYP